MTSGEGKEHAFGTVRLQIVNSTLQPLPEAAVPLRPDLRPSFEFGWQDQTGHATDSLILLHRRCHRFDPMSVEHDVIIGKKNDVAGHVAQASIVCPSEPRGWLKHIVHSSAVLCRNQIQCRRRGRSVVYNVHLIGGAGLIKQRREAAIQALCAITRCNHHRHPFTRRRTVGVI
ncbi:hypothetical protein D9M72_436740 [compost metagenome]